MLSQFEFAVIGGGIAGLSVAAGLAPHGRVVLLEKEARLAGHASGRSVAMYSTHSGNAITRALTRASRSFLEQPLSGWRAGPPLTPRGMLVIAPPDQLGSLQAQFRDGAAEGQPWRELDGTGAAELTPILEASRIAAALHEPGARQMEVDRILSRCAQAGQRMRAVIPSFDLT